MFSGSFSFFQRPSVWDKSSITMEIWIYVSGSGWTVMGAEIPCPGLFARTGSKGHELKIPKIHQPRFPHGVLWNWDVAEFFSLAGLMLPKPAPRRMWDLLRIIFCFKEKITCAGLLVFFNNAQVCLYFFNHGLLSLGLFLFHPLTPRLVAAVCDVGVGQP